MPEIITIITIVATVVGVVCAVAATVAFCIACAGHRRMATAVATLADSLRANAMPAGNVASEIWQGLRDLLRRSS